MLEFVSVNTGKFYIPDLDAGSYFLQVEFDLSITVEFDGGCSGCGELSQTVEIDEHLGTVTRTADKGECVFQGYQPIIDDD